MSSEGNFISEFVIPMFPKGGIGVCVDIGAYDPEWINNSIELEERGWECFCIEPNPHCIPALKEKRKHVLQYAVGDTNEDNVDFYIAYSEPQAHHVAHLGEAGSTLISNNGKVDSLSKSVAKVKLRTFEWLMENEIRRPTVDVISIDVEGNELAVLSTIDVSRWLPKVIICENSFNDEKQYEWFERNGFGRIKRHCENDIYVRLSEINLRIGR
jgi:FkbM family methyltransferase